MSTNIRKVIREHGVIKRTSDWEDPASTFSELFVGNKAFDSLRNFIAENQDEELHVEKSFTYHRARGKEYIKVRNYVGVVETRDGTTIEILPKIHNASEQDTRRIFLRMLKCLRDSPFINIDQAHLKVTRFPILEVFISAYLDELDKLVKQGIRKHYVSVEENQRYLKGRLLFDRQITENLVHRERFCVEYDEFLADIAHNRLIKSTLRKIASKSCNVRNQNTIRRFTFVFSEVPTCTNLDRDFQLASGNNRLFAKYDQLTKWARVFLFNQSFTNFRGKHVNQAILFPMERIFEDYVAAGFKKYVTDYSVSTQDRVHYLVHSHKSSSRFRIKPDIVLMRENEKHVIDTKWKLIDASAHKQNYNISQADMYQLFAYGQKYTEKENCPVMYLIYPKQKDFQSELSAFVYQPDPPLVLRVIPYDLGEGLELETIRILMTLRK